MQNECTSGKQTKQDSGSFISTQNEQMKYSFHLKIDKVPANEVLLQSNIKMVMVF